MNMLRKIKAISYTFVQKVLIYNYYNLVSVDVLEIILCITSIP